MMSSKIFCGYTVLKVTNCFPRIFGFTSVSIPVKSFVVL